jgi:hypothetical protein
MRVLSQFIFEASLGKKIWHSTAMARFLTKNRPTGPGPKRNNRKCAFIFRSLVASTAFNFGL